MMLIEELVSYIDSQLVPERFSDYAPNGLQIAGKSEVQRIVTGVTANQAFIDAAVAAKADVCLVHHGFFWKGEAPNLVGMKYARIRSLIVNEINLLAYHLPLDAHDDFGNNVQLAQRLDLELQGILNDGCLPALTRWGYLNSPLAGEALAARLQSVLDRAPLHIAGQAKKIEKVALCTGAAQDMIVAAIEAGCDAFITGEVSERTVDLARESGIHFYAAGHYATEQFGVQALGKHLATIYDITHQFIPIYNPV
jgi:dinuclear metal center YbgI/SA1388 family protein